MAEAAASYPLFVEDHKDRHTRLAIPEAHPSAAVATGDAGTPQQVSARDSLLKAGIHHRMTAVQSAAAMALPERNKSAASRYGSVVLVAAARAALASGSVFGVLALVDDC